MKKNTSKKLAILGDLHATFGMLDIIDEEFSPDYIIQCGDFGVWNNHTSHELKYNGKAPVYWLRGNHENHDMLDNYFGKDLGKHGIFPMKNDFFKYAENVHYCHSGTVLKLGEKKILMLGGADSIDKDRRTEGRSWWSQEIPRKECQQQILNTDFSDIDIVVSHATPLFVQKSMPLDPPPNRFTNDPNYHDPTTDYLEQVYKHIKSKNNKLKQWIFGHYHMPFKCKIDDCNFLALDALNSQKAYFPPVHFYTIIEV